MLALVLPDRHLIGLVDQDVCGLQDRVREKSYRDAALFLLRDHVLELGHPPELSELGNGSQHPLELRMLRYMGLNEQGSPVGIDTDGDQRRGEVER
jgi:hypothetical protein